MNLFLIFLLCAKLLGGVSDGHILFSPIISTPEEGTIFQTYLIDNNHNTVKIWHSDYCVAHTPYIFNDTILFRPGRISPPFFDTGGIGGVIQKYNWSGDVVWETMWANNQYQQHHDIHVLSNGNILFISYDRKSQQEALAAGKVAHTGDFWSETIFEIEPVGETDFNIVWQWSLWDHLIQEENSNLDNYKVISEHPNKLDINYLLGSNEGPVPPQFNNPDFLHLNGIDYNEELDLIVFSSRKSGEIYIIDHSTTTEEAASDFGGNYNKGGGFLYRWGNPSIYDRGLGSDQKLFAPHGVNWVDGSSTNLLIFNNGVGRPEEPNLDVYSSIEEIVTPFINNQGYYIDPEAPYGPDDYYWYYADYDLYSNIQSGAYRLNNGNTLITYTALNKVVEVSNDFSIVWEYSPLEGQPELLSRANRYEIFTLGDTNYDFNIDILDVVGLADWVLNNDNYNYLGDLNSDGIMNIFDIIEVINIIIDN